MKKKIFCIIVILVILLFSHVANAKISRTGILKEERNLENKEILLGAATIIGTGEESSSIVQVSTEDNLLIGLDSKSEYVNLKVEYSMQCPGSFDDGRVYLLVQLNGASLDLQEAITQDEKSGTLILEDVLVNRWDIITYEVGGVYTNLNPAFSIPEISVGGGTFDRNIKNIWQHPIFYCLFQMFPMLYQLVFK
jgi:hypothetical protein